MKAPLYAAFAATVFAVFAVGCGSETADDDDSSSDESAFTEEESRSEDGVLYFHGMSRLGFARDPLRTEVGDDKDLSAPSMTDGQLQSASPSQAALTFLEKHPASGVVGGYSLGRIPVFRLMQAAPKNMTRVVMIDPTYDSASGIGKGIGGGIARQWLDGGETRSFMLVYGDATISLEGERSYLTKLRDHPRAELCYIPGDHARFRKNDMTKALTAESCSELKARL